MSTFDMVYLGVVIAGMISLAASIGWACWYTRDRPAKGPAAAGQQSDQPDRRDRLAA